MKSKNAIEIRNVTKSFTIQVEDDNGKKGIAGRKKLRKKKNTVLDNINLEIRKGDVLGVIGRNGSGKSTFLSILARIMEPDSGTISRSGKIAAILELGMGFHPDMTGRENIYTKGELYGFSKKEMDAKIETIIDYSGVRKYIDNPVRTYSSGMTGRLAFSIMINVDSDIILVDEVLSVGDSSFSEKAKQHFIEMAQSEKTVVIVSHNLNYIEEVCNRVIWIENGKIILDGDPKDVCAEYQNRVSEDPDIIFDLAQSGVADAQYKLALMYRDGNHFDKDESQYVKWLRSAADRRSVRAQVLYGDILMDEGNEDKALKYYQNAAERGDWEARVKVASISSSNGDDIRKLISIYEKTIIPGNGMMEYRLAELLLKTAWSNEDRERSFQLFYQSASHNYPDALFQIATMYRDGIGTQKDYKKMIECLNKSAEQGLIRSMALLSDIYSQGKIVPKDNEISFKWALKAAELGHKDFMYRVAVMYRDGIGTAMDENESNRWFNNYWVSNLFWQYAWASNYLRTLDNVGLDMLYETTVSSMSSWMIYQYMSYTKDMSKKKELFNLLEMLAQSGNQDAINKLGYMFLEGYCVDSDLEKALYWYEKGALYGNVWSCTKAGEMYRDGIGVKKDIERAIYYFKCAALNGDLRCIEYLIQLGNLENDHNKETIDWAIKILENHAESGNADAIKRIGNMYLKGLSVEKNIEVASKWYKKGAELGDASCKKIYDEINSK